MKIGRKTEKGVVQVVLICIFLTFLSYLVPVPYTSTLPAMAQNNPKHPKLNAFVNKAEETIQFVRDLKPTWESHYKDGLKDLQEKQYGMARNHLEKALVLAEKLPDREVKVAATKQVLTICLRDDISSIKHGIPLVPPIKGDLLVGLTIFFGILAVLGYAYAKGANAATDPVWLPFLALLMIVLGVGSALLYGPLSEIESLEKRIAELE